ncbi:OsmC family protein [Metabacillus indicus]|uniref:OsmC family protein n=1 Tax=Metabacillus indicus TaxID=246786 RepID=UPI003CEB3FB6
MIFNLEDQHAFQTEGHFGKLHISTDESLGFKPIELFLSSMAGCSGSMLLHLLKKKRISISDLQMSVSAERDSGAANRISALLITAELFTPDTLSVHQNEQLSELVIKNCGMLQTISGNTSVDFKINLRSQKDA